MRERLFRVQKNSPRTVAINATVEMIVPAMVPAGIDLPVASDPCMVPLSEELPGDTISTISLVSRFLGGSLRNAGVPTIIIGDKIHFLEESSAKDELTVVYS